MYRTILVPLDGSTRAERILPHVQDLAQRFKARVILLQVAQDEAPVHVPPEMAVEMETRHAQSQMTRESVSAKAQAYLESKQAYLRGLLIDTEIRVQEGPVVQAIIDSAESENADLIAMASHGRTGLGQVFYGSVAAGVLHRIDRPLLIIRAEDP